MQTGEKAIKGGGITTPRMLHRETGILPGAPASVIVDAAGIHIAKHVPVCRLCETAKDVTAVCRMEVCRTCAGEIVGVLR